jgi:hypothetical protein
MYFLQKAVYYAKFSRSARIISRCRGEYKNKSFNVKMGSSDEKGDVNSIFKTVILVFIL